MKPSGIDVNLKYVCPQCDEDHWVTFDEARTPGFLIVCGCKYVLKLTTISTITCEFKYKDSIKQETRQALLRLGYTEKEFADALSRATSGTVESMVREVLSDLS